MALRTVGIRLQAEVAGYINNMRTAKAATGDFVKDLDRAAKAGKLDAVADQAGRMGLVLAAGFAVAVNAAAKFDKQMSEVGAVSNATGADLERLRRAALQAGKDTAFSATEAAKAQAELAKAGMSTADILGGGLRGALDLAAAGSLDLAEAADISAKTMNLFGLTGGKAGHVADLLAAAANKSATDVHEMGQALKMGGLAAAAAGLSVEETTGTLAAFADRALVGSDAGTSFKTMLMMIQAPSDKAADLMKKLGISAYDAGGNFIGTAALAGVLQRQLGGLTQEQRNAALATIFGADAMRAANVLYQTGEQGIRDYVNAVDDQGAAAEVAAKKTDNLVGDIERLKGSLETLAIESSTGANSGLRTMAQTAQNVVENLSGMPAPLQSAAVLIAGVGGAALLTAAGIGKIKAASGGALDALASIGPRGERAARGLEKTAKWAGRAGVAFAALQVGGAVVSSFINDLNPQIEALTGGLEEWDRKGRLAGEAARVFGKDAGDLERSLSAVANSGFSQSMDKATDALFGFVGAGFPLDAAREQVKAFDDALTALVRAGSPEIAAALFEEMAKRSNTSIENMRKALPGYAGELENAARAGTSAAAGGTAAAGGIDATGEAAAEAKQKVDDLKDAFDELFGIQMTYDKAQIAFKKGVVDVAKAFAGANDSISVNTAKGQENRGLVLDQIEAIDDMRSAITERTGSIEKGNRFYDAELVKLGKSLIAKGADKKAVWELINAYRSVPARVVTEATANTKGAMSAIDRLKRYIASVPKYVRVTIHGDVIVRGGGRITQRWGGVYEHAQAGLLREAVITTPREPAAYAYAEPATGGELFAPRYGDPGRTKAMVGYAIENWWGGWDAFMARTPTVGTLRPAAALQVLVRPVADARTGQLVALVAALREDLADLQRAVDKVAPGVGAHINNAGGQLVVRGRAGAWPS